MALRDEIAAFEAMRAELENSHHGKWAVVLGGQVRGLFADFASAAKDASDRYGDASFLLREIGAGPVTLPRVGRYRASHDGSGVRTTGRG